jgi:hypothetical protein
MRRAGLSVRIQVLQQQFGCTVIASNQKGWFGEAAVPRGSC